MKLRLRPLKESPPAIKRLAHNVKLAEMSLTCDHRNCTQRFPRTNFPEYARQMWSAIFTLRKCQVIDMRSVVSTRGLICAVSVDYVNDIGQDDTGGQTKSLSKAHWQPVSF